MKNILKLTFSFSLFVIVFVFSFSASAAQPSDFGLKEGDLISAIFSDDPDVYIINEHGYKRLFLNPEIFNFYGHLGGFFNVKLVTQEARDAFPTSGLFRNCENGDEKVYGIGIEGEDEGQLHWINTTGKQAVKEDPEFFKKVFCVNRKEFNWYQKAASFDSVTEVPKYERTKEVATVSTEKRLEAKAETKNIGKVIICHYPPENIRSYHTLEIDTSALKAHLNHGDTIGACIAPPTPTPTTTVIPAPTTTTSPSPTASLSFSPIPTPKISISPSPISSSSYSPTPTPTPIPTSSVTPTPTPIPTSSVTPTPTPISTPFAYSVTLLSPNGGERWEADQTYTVQWSTPNYMIVSNFEVNLYSVDSSGNLTPTSVVVGPAYIQPSLTSFSWKVPYSIFGNVSPTTTTRYKLRITLLTNGYTPNATKYYDYSDGVFSITGVSSTPTPTPTPTPTTSSVSYDNFSRNIAGISGSVFTRNLYLGSTGSDVKQLQALLVNEVGYSADLITGYFGSITKNAVKKLQEKYGVRPVSGYFGGLTRKALGVLISN